MNIDQIAENVSDVEVTRFLVKFVYKGRHNLTVSLDRVNLYNEGSIERNIATAFKTTLEKLQ